MGYMVLICLDDGIHFVGYDGVFYKYKEDAERVCSEAGEYFDTVITEVKDVLSLL